MSDAFPQIGKRCTLQNVRFFNQRGSFGELETPQEGMKMSCHLPTKTGEEDANRPNVRIGGKERVKGRFFFIYPEG